MQAALQRYICAAALLLLVIPSTSLAADPPPTPPVKYVGDNTGTIGFLDIGGVRLRSSSAARGIRAGDFLIWPSLVLEGRYDSNLFRESERGIEEPTAVPVLRIMPGLAVSNPNPSKISLSLGAGADVRLYISEDQEVSNHTNVGVSGDFKLGILPKGAVTVWLVDTFRRTLATGFPESSATFNRNANKAGATVSIHPGGGALDISLGYRYSLTFFDDFESGDSQSHDLMFRTTWRFYPKTLALLEATASLMDWDKEASFSGLNVDNNQVRVYAGLSGFITKRLATLFKVGYGNSLHSEGPTYSSVIGQAELQYKFSTRVLGAAGYLRNYRTGFWANFTGEDRVYMRWQLGFHRRFGMDVYAAFGMLKYAEFDPSSADYAVNQVEREDQQVLGHVRFNINVARWLGVSLGYEINALITNYEITRSSVVAGEISESLDPGEFIRHQAYVSANFRY